MRILYDPTTFVQQRYGGISRYFTEIISRMVEMPDFQVSLYMGLYVNRYGLEKMRDRYEHFGGMRRPFLGKTHQLAQWLSQNGFARFSRRVPYDLYHATGFFESYLQTDRPKVITVHDMIHFQGLWNVLDWVKAISSNAIRSADQIICVSHSTARDVVKYLDIPEDRITTIHHGAPIKREVPAGRQIKEPYILYVGFRPKYKNVVTLIEAYGKLRDLQKHYRLVFFGGGPIWPWETEVIDKLGIADRITLIETGDDTMLAGLYANASAFVYPSNYEGFGIPLLEAFTYGCPVISSNRSSLPEVGGDAAVYFDSENVIELSEKLREVLEDGDLRAKLIQSGTQRLKQFDWDRCAREHADVYRKAIGLR